MKKWWISGILLLSFSAHAQVSEGNCGYLGCGDLPTPWQVINAVLTYPPLQAEFKEQAKEIKHISAQVMPQKNLMEPVRVSLSIDYTSGDNGQWYNMALRCALVDYVDPKTKGSVPVGEIKASIKIEGGGCEREPNPLK